MDSTFKNKSSEKYDAQDDYIFASRILDIIKYARNGKGIKFTDFLDLRRQNIVTDLVNSERFRNFAFYGVYDDAQRVIAAFLPDYADIRDIVFPVKNIKITYHKEDRLTHRDILGALIGLGIKRDAIGDIVKINNGFIAFIKTPVADYVLSNFDKAGKVKVTCTEVADVNPGDFIFDYRDIFSTVSSNRLDCIVSALCNISRTQSAEIIKAGLVFVDYARIPEVTYNINNGNIISIRGHGKYKIESFGGISRKGRLHLNAKKYL